MIVIREGDHSRKVSKQRAVVMSTIAKALKGDTKAAALVTTWMMRLLDTGEDTPEATDILADEEREILEAYEAKVLREAEPPAEPDAKDPDDKENES